MGSSFSLLVDLISEKTQFSLYPKTKKVGVEGVEEVEGRMSVYADHVFYCHQLRVASVDN